MWNFFVLHHTPSHGSGPVPHICIFTLHSKLNHTVYCYRSCLWACLQRAGVWAVSVTTITLNCIYRLHQTGSVGAGSDHLQLIKFWRSCIPGKGVCGGAKIFGSALLRPARSVCVSPSTFFHLFLFFFVAFIHICLLIITMTDRIMHSERHAEYIRQENEQQMMLVMNVNTLVYTTYVQ